MTTTNRPVTRVLRVRLDGVERRVTCHHGHWLPRLIGYAGVAIGTTLYLRPLPDETHPALLGHELVHVLDFTRWQRRVWGQSYALAVLADLAHYVWAWVRVGCRYDRIPEEIRAYGEQYLVVYRNHPEIDIVGTA